MKYNGAGNFTDDNGTAISKEAAQAAALIEIADLLADIRDSLGRLSHTVADGELKVHNTQ